MANRYLWSGAGSSTSPFTANWAAAATLMSLIDGVDAAGDVIWVASVHAETPGAAVSYSLAGTATAPTQLISCDKTADPPTASAAGGKITTSGASSSITFSCTRLMAYGLVLEAGSGASTTCDIIVAGGGGHYQQWEGCAFRLLTSGASTTIRLTNSAAGKVLFRNSTVKFAAAGQGVRVLGVLEWDGGGLESGGTSPTTLINNIGGGAHIFLTGLDLSAASAGMNIFATSASYARGMIRDSRLPTSWSGALLTGTITSSERYEMYNCSDGATNYVIRVADYAGTLTEDTSVYRNSGYSMSGTAMSWKVTGTANAKWPAQVFRTPEFGVWVDSASGYTSVTVAVATDNITLTDQQCWLEVVSLDSASYPLGTMHRDDSAAVGTLNWLATASNQTTDGTSTWTGVPGTPVKQKLTVAIAPGMSGYILCRVAVVLSGTQSVYIDPHPVLA